MNAYYQKNSKRTLVTDKNLFPTITICDKLISFICSVIAILTCSAAVKIEKATVCTVGFFSFFGLIGSMDMGNIGLFLGVVLCAAIAFIEFLVFKSMITKNAKQ